MKTYREVGRVLDVVRYPVKSMRGESTKETRIGWHGLKGDRRFGFLRLNDKTGFPWLTARELPTLVTFGAYCANGDDPEHATIRVRLPNALEYDVKDPALTEMIANLAGQPVHLIHLYGGIFDANDISVITTQSIASVSGETHGRGLDTRRFRPNILVEAFGDSTFPEEKWIGELLVFGERPDSARVRMYRKDLRCVVVNVNPDTGLVDSDALSVIARSRKNLLGLYAGAERPGTIAVGDVVRMVIS